MLEHFSLFVSEFRLSFADAESRTFWANTKRFDSSLHGLHTLGITARESSDLEKFLELSFLAEVSGMIYATKANAHTFEVTEGSNWRGLLFLVIDAED